MVEIHVSLKYCNCCNQTLLTPWDRKIDLNRGKFIGHTFPDEEEYDYYCPLDGTEFQTLIIPPSFIKSIGNPIISQLFSEASREIRLAREISMPWRKSRRVYAISGGVPRNLVTHRTLLRLLFLAYLYLEYSRV